MYDIGLTTLQISSESPYGSHGSDSTNWRLRLLECNLKREYLINQSVRAALGTVCEKNQRNAVAIPLDPLNQFKELSRGASSPKRADNISDLGRLHLVPVRLN